MNYREAIKYPFTLSDAGDAIAFIVKIGTPLDTTSKWRGQFFPPSPTRLGEDVVTTEIRDNLSIEALNWLIEIEDRCSRAMVEFETLPQPKRRQMVAMICNRIIDECMPKIRLEALEMATRGIDFLTGKTIK